MWRRAAILGIVGAGLVAIGLVVGLASVSYTGGGYTISCGSRFFESRTVVAQVHAVNPHEKDPYVYENACRAARSQGALVGGAALALGILAIGGVILVLQYGAEPPKNTRRRAAMLIPMVTDLGRQDRHAGRWVAATLATLLLVGVTGFVVGKTVLPNSECLTTREC